MRKIIAPDGYVLTQAAAVADDLRHFAKEVYLGKYDSPENWATWATENAYSWLVEQGRQEEADNLVNLENQQRKTT